MSIELLATVISDLPALYFKLRTSQPETPSTETRCQRYQLDNVGEEPEQVSLQPKCYFTACFRLFSRDRDHWRKKLSRSGMATALEMFRYPSSVARVTPSYIISPEESVP